MSSKGRWPNPKAQRNKFSMSPCQGTQLSDAQIAKLSANGQMLFFDEDAQWISDVLDSPVVHTRASLFASVKGILDLRKKKKKLKTSTVTVTNTNTKMIRLMPNGNATLQAYREQSQSRVLARRRNEAESHPTLYIKEYSMHNETNLPQDL